MRFNDFGLKVLWGRINVRTWRPLDGAGLNGPKILLAHGYSDSAGCFTQVVKNLPSDWNIAAFDFPGHGDSSFPDSIFPPHDLNLRTIGHVVEHLGWEQFHLVGHSMGGNLSSAYNILFPEQLKSLSILDVPGIWCLRPEAKIPALKMAMMIDQNQMESYYKPGRPRLWNEWRELIKNSKNSQAEEENYVPWFPNDQVADEWLTHTLRKLDESDDKPDSESLWIPKTHPRLRFPYPNTTASISDESMFVGAAIVDTPVLRIDCHQKIKWKEENLDVDRNRAFFELLKSNSRLGKRVTIEGTHMLTLTNPQGVAKELIDFIPQAEQV